FTDHMFVVDYSVEKGWHDAKVMPYGKFEIDPSAMVLHYGQEIFEGMKCYRTENNEFNLFRPLDNFNRLNKSAERICMANIPVELCMDGLIALLSLDKEWTPHTPGTSLYIRPTMIATDPFLGVKASQTYKFYIILSPVGAYYAEGLAPVEIFVEDEYVRAVRGGIGTAKTGGNYAASILAGAYASKKGFAQVMWLDGVEQKYVDEVGSMNMMFVYGDTVVTPALNGSILPGITRDSILKIAKDLGYSVEEKSIAIDDVIKDAESGKLTEAFGTGTAAVISPVSGLHYKNKTTKIGDGTIGKVSQQLYDTLTGIQYGKVEDKFNWILKV
ncbi:MAG: branched-chain amino acid aminotransferase, partial [Christensenellaceae bacterium]|nr:branched-chain amino acid aminotransferase [Christensenellaceae bacterium]